MINNLFEKALQNKESDEFFKGLGSYFVRNRETGEHSYNTQMSGSVVNYIDSDDHRMQVFSNAFKSFVNGVKPDDFESIQCILINISAYFIAKNRGLFPESDFLSSDNDPVFKEFNCLLNKLTDQPFTSKEKEVLENYSAFLYKNNAQHLADLLTNKLLTK